MSDERGEGLIVNVVAITGTEIISLLTLRKKIKSNDTSGDFPMCCVNTAKLMSVDALLLSCNDKRKVINNFSVHLH